jgi:hypothetical protein
MGEFNVIPTLISARQERRAQEEANYLNQRRKVEDPRNDALANDVTAARAVNVGKYGIQAADPVTYGQLEGIAQRKERHPYMLEGDKLAVEQNRQTIDHAEEDQGVAMDEVQRASAGRALAGLANSGAATPEDAVQYFAKLRPEELASLDMTSEEIPQLVEMLGQFGDIQQGVAAMRHRLGTPDRIKQVVTGLDANGKPVNYGVGDDQAPGALPVSPDDRLFGLEKAQLEADINASRALAGQRSRSNTGKGTGGADGDAVSSVNSLRYQIANMRDLLDEAKRTSTFTDQGGDADTNIGAAIANSAPGRFFQGAFATEQEEIRKNLSASAGQFAQSFRQASDMGVRMLDTEKEYARFIEIINDPGSPIQSQYAALDRLEQTFLAELENGLTADQRAGLAPTRNAPAVAPGALKATGKNTYKWTPGE